MSYAALGEETCFLQKFQNPLSFFLLLTPVDIIRKIRHAFSYRNSLILLVVYFVDFNPCVVSILRAFKNQLLSHVHLCSVLSKTNPMDK